MATLILGSAIATLDTTIATTALPTIATDLHASPETSIWIINAYQLAMVATLLPLAACGDIVGHRRIYTGGLALFTLASLACGLASSLPMLIAARTLQGIGAAGILSVTSALIRFIYPHSQIGRAQGLNALIVAVFFAIGPLVASGVLAVTTWPWLFLINIPLGAFAVVLAFRALPRTTGERPSHSFDGTSGILVAGMFGLLILGLGDAAHQAGLVRVLCEWGASLVCFGALLSRQRRHPAPLLPVDLCRRPLFALSVLTSIFAYAAQGLAFVSLPFLFETVMGRSQTETGLLLTPWPVMVAVVALIAGRLSERRSVAVLGGVGLLLLCLGMALLAFLPDQATFPDIAWRLAICGAGFGLFQSPNLKALTASVPRERAGAASGIIPTARLLGQALGTALVAACFTIGGEAGSMTALWLGSAFSALACATSLMRYRKEQ
ncbi:MAG: MFS transporter [Tistrella sp.]|uniref:MFS transporter n=1 Tax=Tistrella mobilis TaxID=171437 RepID=A0A3B9IHV3_9PROT|nr:MFS transporter [Tistrella sp.]MAD37276.1 MFS transporter [Tistrella sp.]MBA77931.1 MFS transporter [Tistrella sp.]HAE47375.1 MFS transporter [Tistrella mobilis]